MYSFFYSTIYFSLIIEIYSNDSSNIYIFCILKQKVLITISLLSLLSQFLKLT